MALAAEWKNQGLSNRLADNSLGFYSIYVAFSGILEI
jgi:hypothetical protein